MDPFKFKQFEISHHRSGIRVGTDGVLLGAWARHPSPNAILDIGTGCGVIALMLAQRFPLAQITGVDINEQAVLEAKENAIKSPWKDRIEIEVGDARESIVGKYDLICVNPPFFSNSTQGPNENRAIARHQTTLTIPSIIAIAAAHLNTNGQLCMIVPSDTTLSGELHLSRVCMVKPTPEKPAKRKLVALQIDSPDEVTEEHLTIEVARHEYSEAYKNLTSAFYLHM